MTKEYQKEKVFVIVSMTLLVSFFMILTFSVALSEYRLSNSERREYQEFDTQTEKKHVDVYANISVIIPNSKTWSVVSKLHDAGWTKLNIQKIMTEDDLQKIRSTIIDSPLYKDPRGFSFVNVDVYTYKFEPVTFSDIQTNKNFHEHELKQYVESTEFPRKVLATEHAYVKDKHTYISYLEYTNTNVGSTGKTLVITFIYHNVGYVISYTAAYPLYDTYLDEAMRIIDSIVIEAGDSKIDCIQGYCS